MQKTLPILHRISEFHLQLHLPCKLQYLQSSDQNCFKATMAHHRLPVEDSLEANVEHLARPVTASL